MGKSTFNSLDKEDEGSVHDARDALALAAGDMLYSRFRNLPTVGDTSHQLYDHFKIRDLGELLQELAKTSPERSELKYWRHVLDESKEPGRVKRKESGGVKNQEPGCVLFFDAACGALEAVSILQAKLSRSDGKHCLWFELADYVNGDALLRDILRSIALRTGRFQREHVTLHPLDKSLQSQLTKPDTLIETANQLAGYLARLCKVDRLSPSDWPVLIYGRDLAGSCVNWQSEPWEKHTWNELFALIGALAMAGFPVLLAHSTKTRQAGEQDKWNESEKEAKRVAFAITATIPPVQQQYLDEAGNLVSADLPDLIECIGPDARRDERLSIFSTMRDKIFRRCLVDAAFRKFVYAVCLFRQSRRPSALFYEAVQPCGNRFNRNGIDNDVRRFRFAEKAIGELEMQRVFYTKAGGSSWMHRDIRVALHMMLDRVPWQENGRLYWHSQSVGRTHFWIGDWYEKAFYSTGFSKPVFEALHHYFQATRLARFALPKGLMETDDKVVQSYRFLLMRSAVNAMTKLLLVARPFLKLWMANLHGFPMFDCSRNKGKESYAHLSDWLWPGSARRCLA